LRLGYVAGLLCCTAFVVYLLVSHGGFSGLFAVRPGGKAHDE
jgi:hypothetical protein